MELKHVAIASILFSVATFFCSVLSLARLRGKSNYNEDSLSAAHLLISLATVGLSVYQLAISVLLLIRALKIRRDRYYKTLWYVSHLSILSIYWILFVLEFSVCILKRRYILATLAVVITVVYQGLFTYFIVVVYSGYYHKD